MPTNLLNAGLPQTFPLFKKKKKSVSAKHNKVKLYKERCPYKGQSGVMFIFT